MATDSSPSVVHVLWSGGVGGIERLVDDLAREQARLGLRVAVAFAQPAGAFARRLREGGVPLVDLGLRSGYDVRPARIVRGANALRRAGVLHMHGFSLPLAAMALGARRPIVFTEHGNFGQGRRVGVSGRSKRFLQKLFLQRRACVLAANSSYTANRMAELYGLDSRRIAIVHNGVAFASNGSPTSRERADDELKLAFVGRLVAWKRVDRIMEAVAGADNRASIRLVIVGGGPLAQELKARAGRLGIQGLVDFRGYAEEIDELLSDVDVLVQPSEGEPFGLAIVEACGRGALPIVFADGGGALEVLPPDGVVVSDTRELARVLSALPGSETVSLQARAARARWARETFPIARTARAYLELYETTRSRE
jgi:glycosyltransferase involved in cell wall biosynthesis